MLCDIFQYGSNGLCGIECTSGTRHVSIVFIHGLTEGFLQPAYVRPLAECLGQSGFRFFQPLLRSSYSGWGKASLDDDAADLKDFINHIRQDRGATRIFLIGHSTGCQDIVHFLKACKIDDIMAVILQGAVSDREAFDVICKGDKEMMELRHRMREEAVTMAPSEFLPREAARLVREGDALIAQRFLSLDGNRTLDDMFSSDLPDEYMKQRFANILVPVLIVQSLKDEYLPSHANAAELGSRIGRNFPNGRCICLDGDHALNGQHETFLAAVRDFVERVVLFS